LFVFLGEDRETALGGEKIYTTIFFLFFCFVSFLVFMLYVFFSFDNFSSQSLLVSGTKNGLGDAMIFCLDISGFF